MARPPAFAPAATTTTWVTTTLLLQLLLVLLSVSSQQTAHAALTVASELTHPQLSGAGGIDAHESIAYVAGDGVSAIDITDPDAPRVLMTLADLCLSGARACTPTPRRRMTHQRIKKRLAVACSGTDSLVLVDAETPEDLKVLGSVAEPMALKGAAGVVEGKTRVRRRVGHRASRLRRRSSRRATSRVEHGTIERRIHRRATR